MAVKTKAGMAKGNWQEALLYQEFASHKTLVRSKIATAASFGGLDDQICLLSTGNTADQFL